MLNSLGKNNISMPIACDQKVLFLLIVVSITLFQIEFKVINAWMNQRIEFLEKRLTHMVFFILKRIAHEKE